MPDYPREADRFSNMVNVGRLYINYVPVWAINLHNPPLTPLYPKLARVLLTIMVWIEPTYPYWLLLY